MEKDCWQSKRQEGIFFDPFAGTRDKAHDPLEQDAEKGTHLPHVEDSDIHGEDEQESLQHHKTKTESTDADTLFFTPTSHEEKEDTLLGQLTVDAVKSVVQPNMNTKDVLDLLRDGNFGHVTLLLNKDTSKRTAYVLSRKGVPTYRQYVKQVLDKYKKGAAVRHRQRSIKIARLTLNEVRELRSLS